MPRSRVWFGALRAVGILALAASLHACALPGPGRSWCYWHPHRCGPY